MPVKPHRKASETADAGRLRLMIVDDGTLVNPPLTRALTQSGFRIEVVRDQNYALTDTRGQRYDAIIINSDFAEVDALWLCLALRVQGCLSVIVVLSNGPSTKDHLAAFRVGATDRVEHAMPQDALVDRILAHIDGARIKVTGLLYPVTAELPTTAGMFTMSLVPTFVTIDDRQLSFTRIEERLFARLWAGQGAVVSPEELIASGWLGRKVGLPTLQVHVSQLRRKLSKLGLVIERAAGRGYRFSSVSARNGAKIRSSLRPKT
jgi:DNA-binding response OmpR family regulator